MKKKIWIIDFIALIGFLLTFKPQITGYTLHEWLGLAVGLVLMVHLLQHWRWVVSMTRIIRRVKAKQRIKVILDSMMAAGFITIILTGLVISSILNLDLLNYDTWCIVHFVASYTTLVLLVAKVALHWTLIRNTFARAFHLAEKQGALSSEQLSRRKFLKATGFAALGFMVGVGGLASLRKNTKAAPEYPSSQPSVQTDEPLATQATTAPASTQETTPGATATAQPTPTTVVQDGQVLCRKGCAYPGSCKDYQDNNQNGLCDLGEPIW